MSPENGKRTERFHPKSESEEHLSNSSSKDDGVVDSHRTTKHPTNAVLPNQLFEVQSQSGKPAPIVLTDDAVLFFTASDTDKIQRIRRKSLAETVIPSVEKHQENLQSMMECNQSKKDKLSFPANVPRLRREVVFSAAAIPLAVGFVLLVAAFCAIFSFEFSYAIALIREGSLFEIPAKNPLAPPLEGSFQAAMGMALAPVFALFATLEFISLTFHKKNSSNYTKLLASASLPMGLACTWIFASIIAGGMVTDESSIGAGYQSQNIPWYFIGLTMTTMSLVNSMIMYGIMWVIFYCFELAPKEEQFSADLENAGIHLTGCIKATAGTLGILNGARHVEENSQRCNKLQSELSNLNS